VVTIVAILMSVALVIAGVVRDRRRPLATA
jgi:hypothetical protein